MGKDVDLVGQVGKGAGKGAEHAAADLAGGLIRLLPPWAAAATLPAAGWLCGHLWGAPETAAWAAMAMTAITGGLSALAWRVTHARRWMGQLHVTVNTAASLGWVTVATVTGPFSRPTIDIWLGGTFTLALAWNLRNSGRRHAGDGEDPYTALFRRVRDKTGVAATARAAQIGPDRSTAAVQVADGQTLADLIRVLPQIAAMAGIPANGARVTPDPDDASRGELTLVRRDMLRAVTPWAGPAHVGGLPTDPIEVGTYEDAVRAEIVLPAVKGKNAVHVGIGGANGAGKSGVPLISAGTYFCRYETAVWVIDTVKREQTFGPLADRLDWFAPTLEAAHAMLDTILAEIAARAEYLGTRGYRSWEPGCGIANILAVIEEAPALSDDDGDGLLKVVKLIQRARSVGINIMVSGQRWSYDNLPTSLREEVTGAFQFGCNKASDAEFLLGDLVEQGADPSSWKTLYPGRCYMQAPGVPEERHRIPLRLDDAAPADVARLVAPHAIPAGTTAGGGSVPICLAATDAYTTRTRWERGPDGTVAPAGGTGTHVSGGGWTPPEQAGPGTDTFTPSGDDHDPDVVCTIDDEIPPMGGIEFPSRVAEQKAPPDEAREVLRAYVAERRESRERFMPKDVRELAESLGYTGSWVRHELRRMADGNEIVQLGNGEYSAHEVLAGVGV